MSDAQPDEQRLPADHVDDAGGAPANSIAQIESVPAFRALRIWPACLLVVILWTLKLSLQFVAASTSSFQVLIAWFMGPLVCAGLILLWWLFFSRASMKEKALGILGLIAIAAITMQLADKSMQGAGTMLFAVPWGISGFTVGLICLARRLSMSRAWFSLLAAVVCFGYWDLVRMDEVWGDFRVSHTWRWEPTAEDDFLQGLASRSQKKPVATMAADQVLANPEWSGFRGPHRNGVQPGLVLGEDWDAQPLKELWRVRVGPGWSSFCVAGTRLFTQEQRGEDELVVCYDANSGAEIWVHEDESRFWEAMGGAGPRATPTLAGGNLFALGATGILTRLDPVNGEQVWQQDIGIDADRKPPTWGFASSPLVTHGVVIVHAGGPQDKGMLAYDVETGDPRWTSPSGDDSYSSPQLSTVDGKECVLMSTNMGISIVDPTDGKLLGKHDWVHEGYRVVQPLVLEGSSLLLGSGIGSGTQRIDLRWDGAQFNTQTGWQSLKMSPDFSDAVVHDGYLYGFDKNIFACVDIATGKRKWKRGRYGSGQVLLLPDADQLLVISEAGELVLLRATPEKLVELTRHQALNGRTWNHPVLVGNRLFVRNSEEAACFEVPIVQPAAG